jgi:hypothetical protein
MAWRTRNRQRRRAEANRQRLERQLQRRAKEQGYGLKNIEPPPAVPVT